MEVVLLVVRGDHVMTGVVFLLLLLFLFVLMLAFCASIWAIQAYFLQSLVAAGRLPLVGLLKR